MTETIAFILALVLMLVGAAGTLLPALPGLPLIWLSMLGYGAIENFQDMDVQFLTITLAVVALSFFAEHYAKAWGARRFGAGRAGAWGAVIGSIVGLFFVPIGLVLGPFLGALLAELLAGRPASEAVRAGWGGLIGVLGSVAVNVVVALSLTVAFVVKVIF